jgi:hypothetical protein
LRVEALQPSTLRVLGWEDFEDIVLRNPEVGVKTIRLLSERLAVCEGRLSDVIRKEVPARLAGLILGLSEHQSVITGDGSRRIPTRYTLQQLGTMIGAKREAVTRAIGRLRKTGAVEIRDRHVHVTDADALERLAETGRSAGGGVAAPYLGEKHRLDLAHCGRDHGGPGVRGRAGVRNLPPTLGLLAGSHSLCSVASPHGRDADVPDCDTL